MTDQQAAELDKLKLAAEAQVNTAPVRGLGTGVQDMAPQVFFQIPNSDFLNVT